MKAPEILSNILHKHNMSDGHLYKFVVWILSKNFVFRIFNNEKVNQFSHREREEIFEPYMILTQNVFKFVLPMDSFKFIGEGRLDLDWIVQSN